MKSCSYCGRQNNDGSPRCRECGTLFALVTDTADAGASDRDRKTIILRRFTSEIAALAAVATLGEVNILSTVISDDCGGMLAPLGNATGGFRLLVNEDAAVEAERALREIEDRPPDPQLE